jgi:ArsR family transcriptional regulator
VLLQPTTRADLFRLLGDEDRLRLFALCAEEELTVGELAELLDDSQPQISRKAQPLRASGLLAARKDGTRTYLKAQVPAGQGSDDDAIVLAALDEGRRLCRKDRVLAKIPRVLRAREDSSRRFFDDDAAPVAVAAAVPPAVLGFLPLLRPLLGERTALCVDVGAGDGLLLPLLSPLFDRVFAVDRSPARLAACARLTAGLDLGNVRLIEGDADDVAVYEACYRHGGASVVVVARTLHHAARPADLLAASARLLRDGGVVVVVDYLPHDDEAMRALGDVWLGFPPERLAALAREAGLVPMVASPMSAPPSFPDSHLPWQWLAATKGAPPARVGPAGPTAVQ